MADLSKITLPDNTKLNIKDTTARAGLATKQDTLVSGTNIKTINNESLLGSGNITIQGGGDSLPDQTGHSGDILTTNGTAASWMDVSEASSVSIDTSVTPNSSNLITSGAVATAISNIDALPSQTGNSGKFLTTNGTDASWANVPEEVFVATYNTTSYADVLAAYNAGKTLFCERTDGNYYYLAPLVRVNSTYSASEPVFAFEYTFGNTISRFNLDNTQWWDGTFQLVPSSRTINSKNLTSDITLDASDVGAIAAPSTTPVSGDILIYDGTSWTAGIPNPRPIESVSSSIYTIDNTYNHKMVEVVSNSSPAFYIQRSSFLVNDEFWILNSSTSIVTIGGTNTRVYINGNNGDEAIQLNEQYQIAYFKLISTNSINEHWVATIDSAITNSLPSQSGNSGKYLTTNGTTASWASISIPTASTTTPSMDGTASYGSGTSYARSNHVHPTDTSRAPTSHASSDTTYGTGTSSNYGHLKLSDSTSSTFGTSDGIAATPSAVKSAYDLANGAIQAPSSPSSGNVLTYNGSSWVASAPSGGLPSQSGHSGDYLTTNGTTASWESLPSQIRTTTIGGLSSDELYNAFNHEIPVFVKLSNTVKGPVVECSGPDTNVIIDFITKSGYETYRVQGATWYSYGSTNWVDTSRTINGHSLSSDITLTASDVGAAPTSHASTATTYGAGSASNYGHVKLSDSTSTTSGTSDGTAATPTAVKSAYDRASTLINRTTAVNAADTNYTTLMDRGEKLLDATTYDAVSNWSSELVNGAIAWRYE